MQFLPAKIFASRSVTVASAAGGNARHLRTRSGVLSRGDKTYVLIDASWSISLVANHLLMCSRNNEQREMLCVGRGLPFLFVFLRFARNISPAFGVCIQQGGELQKEKESDLDSARCE